MVSDDMQNLLRRACYSKLPRGLFRLADELTFFFVAWCPTSTARRLLNVLRGVSVGRGGWIGRGCLLGNHPFLLRIGDNVIIADGVKILTHDTSFVPVGGLDLAAEVRIGNNIQIGENAIVLPGVCIGDNCVVGAGAVVIGDVSSGGVWAGVPAKFICSIEDGKKKVQKRIGGNQYFSTYGK